jgi:DNA-directed RNA polymerase subunit K/omega
MFNISTEEMVTSFENRFEAVVVVAQEARRVNMYADEDTIECGEKPIKHAMNKLLSEGIYFSYENKETPEKENQEKKVKKKKDTENNKK